MSKVNIELSEQEAKKYFRKKPLFSFFKKLKPRIWTLIVIGLFAIFTLMTFVEWQKNAAYERGYDYAKSEITKQANYEALQDRSLNYVWEWFLKRVLIIVGYGLPLLFLIMAIVWIIHGSFFKIM